MNDLPSGFIFAKESHRFSFCSFGAAGLYGKNFSSVAAWVTPSPHFGKILPPFTKACNYDPKAIDCD
jgi:hypothetical protein